MADKNRRKVSQSVVKELVEDVALGAEKPVLERITLPIVWQRLPCGVRIQDLHPGRYTDVLSIIMDYYFDDEPMMHAVGMREDEESMDEYLKLVNVWLKDTQSLVAVIEGEANRVVGVIIGRTIDRSSHSRTVSRVSETKDGEALEPRMADVNCLYSNTHSEFNSTPVAKVSEARSPEPSVIEHPQGAGLAKRYSGVEGEKATRRRTRKSELKHRQTRSSTRQSQRSVQAPPFIKRERFFMHSAISMFDDIDTIYSGEALLKVQNLRMHMSKEVDIFDLYNVDVYHRIYLWLVIPQYRNFGVGKALLRSAVDVARCMGVDVVCGQMTSRVAQNIAYKMGFTVEGEMLYSEWVDGEEEVFRDVTTGNHSLAVMAMQIPPIVTDPEMQGELPPPGRKGRRRQTLQKMQ